MQINSLCDPDYIHLPEDIDNALNSLPETLEETYSETILKFEGYSDNSKKTVKGLLKLIMVASIELHASEVKDALLAASSGQIQHLDTADLVRMSLSLVVMDDEKRNFRFAHLSVKEFLEQRAEYAG